MRGEAKIAFYEDLTHTIEKIPRDVFLVLMWDFNWYFLKNTSFHSHLKVIYFTINFWNFIWPLLSLLLMQNKY